MILQALNGYYERVATQESHAIAEMGFSDEKISFAIILDRDGGIVDINDLRESNGRKPTPRVLPVPASFKRPGTAPRSFFLWDKTAFVFGPTRGDGAGPFEHATKQHQAFRTLHMERLRDASDEALAAVYKFVEAWSPTRYSGLRYAEDMIDSNVVFRLDGDVAWVHERTEARELWHRIRRESPGDPAMCLVTGKVGPVARLHPAIRGMPGQTTGGSIVSFNRPAFESYGYEQGQNAPVLESAAFAYTTALNKLLQKGGRNRTEIADTTAVFWAEATDHKEAAAAETAVSWLLTPTATQRDDLETMIISEVMERMGAGRPLDMPELHLRPATRFYILGLVAPDPARLSVRFWEATTLGRIGAAFHQHWRDLRMEPPSKHGGASSVARCALMTAPARRNSAGQVKHSFDDVSPLLAGELMRAILSRGPYPGALLNNLVMRIRTDHDLNRLRIALIKACIVRSMRRDGTLPTEDYLVRTDPDDPNPARRLGRLFAVLERAQLVALGEEINATIKDKYIGLAAATPAQVFSFLIKNSNHHTARLRRGHAEARWIKDAQHARNVGMGLERDIGRLVAPFNDGLPPLLSVADQGLFFVGYYQERFGSKAAADTGDETTAMH